MLGPLAGIRVLDLTTNISGPCATMVLADLGADVIKVERPDGGDDTRYMGPHRGSWGAYFVAINRGKRSLALDLRRPEGRAVILRLVRHCDILIENFRGGKAVALGLDENVLRAARPDIIYASLSAYGPRGPDYQKPGYDAVLQGRTGIISVTGMPEGPPVRAGVSILDMGSGMWVALGIIAALFERQRSGRGQRVEGSLFQTGVMWMAYHLLYRQFSGRDPSLCGNHHPAFAPYGDFPTADGTVLIGISNDRLFSRLCKAIERPGWARDPRFITNPDRIGNRTVLDQEVAAVMRSHGTAAWLAKFDEYGVPASPVQTVGQLMDDPQLAAIGQIEKLDLPDMSGLPVNMPRLPLDLSLTPASIAGPPPRLGEHGWDVLREFGYRDEEVEILIDRGIIQVPLKERR